jgi:hypothetical protein
MVRIGGNLEISVHDIWMQFNFFYPTVGSLPRSVPTHLRISMLFPSDYYGASILMRLIFSWTLPLMFDHWL